MNAPDPIATVAHALRVAAAQDADRAFWTQRDRDIARNHEALWATAYSVLSAIDHGLPPSAGSIARLREALAEKERINDRMTAHLLTLLEQP